MKSSSRYLYCLLRPCAHLLDTIVDSVDVQVLIRCLKASENQFYQQRLPMATNLEGRMYSSVMKTPGTNE